ncbi:hypothetical protein CBR_g57141 [Chara braunii]|uniref:DDE Tnp4 domain-containing protein n=1 Tax=Chara braunii TaxID=69332 RepID=A0A388ME06_CHABU|nr:hypothetical protein CBR_g57141 [Chara braunii]|eukprot:GBG92791.1 hypothetical protein CBR_g57141 [Chara braunii]
MASISSDPQHEADRWISFFEAGGQRLQVLVNVLSTTAKAWPEVNGGVASLEQWLEGMTQFTLEIIWEAEEGPDPRLDRLINWGQANILMEWCYALFEEAHDLRAVLEERSQEWFAESEDRSGLSSGRVFGSYGKRYAVEAEQFSEMDVRSCGHGLREEEIDAMAMTVTVIGVSTMSDMSSSSRDMLIQLRKRRALLQSVAEASDCAATCEAVVQLCVVLSSGIFPRQTPRWWIRRRIGGTWEDLRLCDDATDEYYRQKLRMSMAMFTQIVAACTTYVEKKVTHYRMPLPVEQVIAFALYRWASGETYESGTSAFGIGRATGLQPVRDVTSVLLQAYLNAIKWPVGRRRAQILHAFREKGFPNCFGAIDCTHIYIDKRADAPSDNYYGRKQKFSVQAQVVVDLDLPILDVHVGYPGSVHDVRVLHNSQLWRRAKTGKLFDAPSENLPHGVVT